MTGRWLEIQPRFGNKDRLLGRGDENGSPVDPLINTGYAGPVIIKQSAIILRYGNRTIVLDVVEPTHFRR